MKNNEIDINMIPDLVKRCNFGSSFEVTSGLSRKSGNPRLEFTNAKGTYYLDEGNGLDKLRSGEIDILLKTLAKMYQLSGDFSSASVIDLLGIQKFRAACITDLDMNAALSGNVFVNKLFGDSSNGIPVFYGSTAGINFAEVLETAICADYIRQRGTPSRVLFDYDTRKSKESDNIFAGSRQCLPEVMKEKMLNYARSFEGGLGGARLQAAKELVARVAYLPSVTFINTIDVFRQLDNDFSIGQLLVLAKVAGNDPRLLSQKGVPISSKQFQDRYLRNVDMLGEPVANLVDKRFTPAGFSYYARDAVISGLEGVLGFPLKLTDKGNIYKILLATDALYDPGKNKGAIPVPITRQRIELRGYDAPIDPIALYLLARDQPLAFQTLTGDFEQVCKVLTPEQAVEVGTVDSKFYIDDYFDLGGSNG